ncbi:MAG: SagB/ThcOx family dehydrogenase [Desulfobulbaceae bacterium]|nr:SagB/ThcOx family dehydrogenase [Desulfobulbaceae bacterium]
MNVHLPKPQLAGTNSLEQSLARRRSIRNFTGEPLSLAEISQLLWAAQGITSSEGCRTAPSAGALYPLAIHAAAGTVENLATGVYRYIPEKHELALTIKKDLRHELTHAALGQQSIQNSAVSLVITAVYEKTTWKYGERGIRYVHMDAGHAAQNICLQASALKLGTVPIGAFDDSEVGRILQLQKNEIPLYILPVGRPLT